MFHTSAFRASIANTGALLQLTAVPDSILPTSGLGLLSNVNAYLMALGYVGTNAILGELQAPSLRDYGNLDTQPVNDSTAWLSPPRLDDFSRKMIPAAITEEWDAFAAQNNSMSSETATCVLWSSDGNIDPIPPKKIVQIHWTASVTLVAGKWSVLQMNLAQTLASGRYAIVGGRCLSAGGLAFRFIPSGSAQATFARPGGIAVQAENQMDWPLQRRAGWGKWLDFTNVTIPQIEVLSNSADTSEEGDIDIVPY